MRALIARVGVPLVALLWITSVLVAIGGTVSFAGRVDHKQARLERELAALKIEHRALQDWVAEELRPWAAQVAEVVEAPSGSPRPPLAPSLPPVPSPSPSPSVQPEPSESPPGASPLPSPTVICIPLACLSVSPSPGGEVIP